ncbi:MAG: hypothetical protein IT422_06395 [Pirellulaceae bacterium]|jgi:translocation and assembly module TamB|nr:hypothetical protein [Pirellulaceae bacterium]
MARRNYRSDSDPEYATYAASRPREKRRGRRKYFLGFAVLAAMLLVVLLPTIVARRSILVPLIARFAGIAPLRVELDGVQAGWFTPITATGLQLFDGDGRLLVKIAQVETEKGIWSWIRTSSDLGTIRVSGVEAAISAADGTTNLEQALQPILDQYATDTPTDVEASSAPLPTGTIEVLDSKFLLMQHNRPEQWVVAMPRLHVVLPTAGQVIGPIEMQATVADISGTVADSRGTIAANVQQAAGSQTFELRAKLDSLPVDFWHVVHARLPDVPIDELRGRISATLSGSVMDAERWSFDVQQIESRGLQIVAPELVGTNPAHLEFISASGRAALSDALLKVEGAQLSCDFAQASAAATIPWPIEVPTMQNPFLIGSVIDARGSIDLPKLAQAAQTLLPLRNDTRLMAGQAQFAITQQLDPQGSPSSRASLELSGLQAVASGQQISWNDPLKVDLTANRGAAGLQVGVIASAEFCNLTAGGTIEAGQLAGNVDLDLLQKRASEYIELPVSTMTGNANLNATWQMTSENSLQASGTLKTSPMVIASTSGGQIQEPAWDGQFSATAQLAGGAPQWIERAQLTLKSRDEQLTIDLQEPLSLVEANAGQPPLPPAAFTFNLVGDLANWKRRASMWLSEPPDVKVAGNISVAVGGRIDLSHVEVLEANWRSQPLEFSSPQFSLAEPQMVGSFKGRVDTNDLLKLEVEKLEIQATSFSLGARDSANPDGSGSRVGQAMFLVDLDRILQNVQAASSTPVAVLPPGANAPPPATQYSASGHLKGQLAWQFSSQAAAFNINATGESIVLLSKAPTATTPVPLWEEQKLNATIAGTWIAASGDANIENLQIQLPWMNFAGNVAYRPTGTQQSIAMKGQAIYDSVALSTKLAPMTGDQVQLVGQQTVPIDVTWTSSIDPNASSLAGLKAVTRLGWEQARVAGIQLGKADVPVTIDAGRLATAAEFAVSGGKLRWDVTSDLTATDLVIVQKPMTVLENVEITPEMCQGWLKFVAPLLAEATSIDGKMSLRLDDARLTPADPKRQTVAGQLIMHNVTVGPGPLSNQVISLVKQVDAIRKKDFTQAVSAQSVWMNMPEQQIDFKMADGRVTHRNVNVKVGDANISTSGSVTVDGQLDMLATMPIPDDWIEKSPLLAGMRGQSLNFPVRGTIKQPQMDADGLRQFSRQAVQGAATGLIQQQLSKGLGKLFGQPPPLATPATPPIAPK